MPLAAPRRTITGIRLGRRVTDARRAIPAPCARKIDAVAVLTPSLDAIGTKGRRPSSCMPPLKPPADAGGRVRRGVSPRGQVGDPMHADRGRNKRAGRKRDGEDPEDGGSERL